MKLQTIQQREPAQVIALFAIALLAMLAMVGVVVDGGTLYLQRRTAQNAADAAALAGARALQQASLQSPVPAMVDVATPICNYAGYNAFGGDSTTTPTPSAYYINASGTSLGPVHACPGGSDTIPNLTSGIHVDVSVGPYNTYLVGIVGLRQLQAQASAAAQVGALGIPNPDITPLAGCGPDMLTNGASPTPSVNIMMSAPHTNWIDPQWYGTDLVLQGSQMSQNENATCPKWNGTSSSWKGQIDTSGISGTFTTGAVPVNTGNSTIDAIISSMCVQLYGATHDPTGVGGPPDPNLCRLLVPIAIPVNPPNQANIVTFACFSLYDGGSGTQKWRGYLHDAGDCNYGVYALNWAYGNTNNETRVFLTH
jgi:Flp pilus assembly protein TadG